MRHMNEPSTSLPVAPNSLAHQISKILGESGPMPVKEIKRALQSAGHQHVLQSAISQTLRTELAGQVEHRGDEWGLAGDARFR